MKDLLLERRLGAITLANPIIAAPMAGISTAAFRTLLKEYGAAVAVSEMISAQALCYDNQKTWAMLDTEAEPEPIVFQLCGHEPSVMARAAQLVCEKASELGKALPALDINMGCPAPKIVKNGDGAALSLDPQRAFAVAEAVVRAVDIPVTVKMRLGWSEAQRSFIEMGKGLEQAGVAALTLHGRYREQFYSGTAERAAIGELVRAVKIPVIGNGDIASAADMQNMLAETGCAAVMIGRGCIGNPWLIADCLRVLQGEAALGRPEPREIMRVALLHLRREIENARRLHPEDALAERGAVCAMRAHMGFYLKGLRGAAAMREAINHLESYAEIEAYLLRQLEAIETKEV